MENPFRDNINAIKEIFPGTYLITLDFASNKFIDQIIRGSHRFIWIHHYGLMNGSTWTKFQLPISDEVQKTVMTRQLRYDFMIPRREYEGIKGVMPNGVTLLQINKQPPEYWT